VERCRTRRALSAEKSSQYGIAFKNPALQATTNASKNCS
jgi:hypothetical protein